MHSGNTSQTEMAKHRSTVNIDVQLHAGSQNFDKNTVWREEESDW